MLSLQSSGTSPQTNTDPFLRTFRFGIDPIPVTPASTDLPLGAVGRIISPDAAQPMEYRLQPPNSNDYALEVDYIHVLGLHEFMRRRLNPACLAIR